MRWLGRLLLALLALWLLALAYERFGNWQGWQSSADGQWEGQFDDYRVYWLDSELEFKLPANTEQVRVMLTPTVAQSDAHFSVSFKASGLDGKVIEQGARIFRQKLLTTDSLRYFSQPRGIPANFTSEFYIDGTGAVPLSLLQLKLELPSALKVAVRVAVLERKKDSELAVNWQRMHRDKRAKLLEGNIYPPDLVSEVHRRNALKFQWLPLGPEGIEGEDYQGTSLFVSRQEPVESELPPEFDSSSMYSDSEHVFTLIQSEQNPVYSVDCDKPQQWLELSREIDNGIESTQFSQLPVQLDPMPGLYRIRTASQCNLKMVDIHGQPYEQAPNVLRAFVANSEQPLRYRLSVASDKPQPIRLDVRAFGAVEGNRIHWTLLDDSQNAMQTGQIAVAGGHDVYERLAVAGQALSGVKQETYIMAPPQARELLITKDSSASVLLNVFTRPFELAYDDRHPKWFVLLPVGHQQLKTAGHSQLLYWQQRLKEQPQQTELTLWQALETVPSRPAFELFEAHDSVVTPELGFQPLSFGQQVFVSGGREFITPTLVYRRDNDTPQAVTVWFNGKPYEYWLSAMSGRLSLPQIKPAMAELSIDNGEAVQWFINQQEGESRHRIRRVYPLEDKLRFALTKSEEQEWVTLSYYTKLDTPHTLEVEVEYRPNIGVFKGHTPAKRSFAVEPQAAGAENQLLNQKSIVLFGPFTFKMPLEADLSNGNTHLTVSSSIKGSGFIQASYVHSSPGIIIRHYTEANDAD